MYSQKLAVGNCGVDDWLLTWFSTETQHHTSALAFDFCVVKSFKRMAANNISCCLGWDSREKCVCVGGGGSRTQKVKQ